MTSFLFLLQITNHVTSLLILEEDEDFFGDADEGELSEQGQVCLDTYW